MRHSSLTFLVLAGIALSFLFCFSTEGETISFSGAVVSPSCSLLSSGKILKCESARPDVQNRHFEVATGEQPELIQYALQRPSGGTVEVRVLTYP